MKSAIIAAIVAAIVAAGSAGAALTQSHLQVQRVVGSSFTVQGGSSAFGWASCPGHLKAVGGGVVSDPFSPTPVQLQSSYPVPGIDTWEIAVSNPNSATATVQAVAVCVG